MSEAVKRLLVVDDEAPLRLMVRAVMEDEGWLVEEAADAEQALLHLRDAAGSPDQALPDVVLLDMHMPGVDGLEALPAIRAAAKAPVVMLTAYGTVGSAVEAMKKGAFDYLTKPADNEELKAVLSKAREHCRLIKENKDLKNRLADHGRTRTIIGQSPAISRVREMIEQVGPSEAVVLILGESGTGKELVADSLHNASNRKDGPLIKINCAALPAELLESELFGYVKGAFTGATKDKPGRFQLAHGGTLFLDEIGDMPMALQAKLLRVLQERIVEPLGATKPLPVDVRILAATNRDLLADITEGRFREDLYYRLNVLEIRMPPLRERLEDLPLLAGHLLRKLGEKNKKRVRDIGPAFLDALSRYHWPGNVRELENALERALVLGRSDSLKVDDLPPHMTSPATLPPAPSAGGFAHRQTAHSPAASSSSPSLDDAEKQAIVSALEANNGHRERTAEALGVSRRTLQYKLKKYGLTRR